MFTVLTHIRDILRQRCVRVDEWDCPEDVSKTAALVRLGALAILRRRYRRGDALHRAKLTEKILFYVLSGWGIQAGLGWNSEELDALLPRIFPQVKPGEYKRVCAAGKGRLWRNPAGNLRGAHHCCVSSQALRRPRPEGAAVSLFEPVSVGGSGVTRAEERHNARE